MRNHDQKIKDMSRSVLPSTGRESVRKDRRIIHKRRRARERAAVVAWRRDTDPESVTPDIRGMDARDITWMVWRRRDSDKVGPLIRWAEATIAGDPALRSASRAEQAAYFARLMPDTLIGRHAVQHIEWALERHEWHARRTASRTADPGGHIADMDRRLRQILETGLHANLNVAMRLLANIQPALPCGTRTPPRLLLGSHDIEAFTEAMAPWPAVRDLVAAVAATGQPPEYLSRAARRLQRVQNAGR